MWSTLFKVFTDAAAPVVKPVLEQLVRRAIENFLKNLGGQTGNGLTLPLTADGSDPVDVAITKTVQDMLES